MAKVSIIWGFIILGCIFQVLCSSTEDHPLEYMSKEDREILKEEARDMFYHAYNAYMDNAYPADELMPLSCKGRYRGSEPDRGDIDSTLGNFSLTLVDTLDTLVVLGDLEEFENAVRLVIEDVKFDTDVIVSLFETNIRMLGGLLSGHILAEYLQLRADIMPWYRGELLNLAKDLGYRFLPAFNTTTGIPFGRINLRHGMKGVPAEMCRETCTACAGSMILEMAALSRLTGESIFEDKAQKAMDALWKMRHRGTDLMGSVLNVHSGDWVRRDSGVGAGIDSYYEYCLKAYILLGDEKYLGRFNKHYQAVMKYVSQGPMLLDVHMHRPNTNSKNFMDALLAFWPGLQVLKGDIKPAVETHEMLYQVMQRHNFIPEAFTTDFQVHWGHHPLRPEFLESTYFLYRATGDHYYLGVGRKVLKSLQTYARVPCGYAAVSDVRTNKHDDTMDSFVLSETFKYLFLLFAEPNELVLDLDEFIFTTEGHLLPLTLAAVRTNVTADLDRDVVQVDELDRTCPNSLHLFPASVRQPLRNMVEDVCPRRNMKRRLNASQFQANNLEHLKILSNMGITILTLADGRVQLLHTFSNARTAQDAEEGLLFMQEMVELSRKQSQQSETRPQSVTYTRTDTNPPREVTVLAGPAHFGPGLKDGNKVTGKIEFATPSEACSDLIEPEKLVGKIVMVARGNCMFVEKARRIQKAGAIAGIVLDTVVASSAAVSPMFAMSGDGREPDDVTIPVVFLFNREAAELVVALVASDGSLTVTIGDSLPRDEIQLKAPGDLSVFERLKGSLKDFLIRQITPQNTGITSKPVEAHTAEEEDGVWDEGVPVEYAHLKALILIKGTGTSTGLVKIMRSEERPFASKTPQKVEKTMNQFDKTMNEFEKAMNEFEKTWTAGKQEIVNEIYSSEKSYFFVTIAQIQFSYKMVHKLRGVGGIAMPVENGDEWLDGVPGKLSVWILVRWFLRELSEIEPVIHHPSISDANRPESKEESKLSDGKTFEQSPSLEELVGIANALDLNVLEAINTAREHFDSDKTQKNDDGKSVNLVDSNDQLKSDKKMQFKDILAEDLRVDSLEFKVFLLGQFEKEAKNTIGEGQGGLFVLDIDGEKETPKILRHAHLKANIFERRGIVKIETVHEFSPAPIKRPERLEGYEKTWHELREYLLSVIYAHVVGQVEISIEQLIDQHNTVQALRGHWRGSSTTLEHLVEWYIKELAEVRTSLQAVGSMIDYQFKFGPKRFGGRKTYMLTKIPVYSDTIQQSSEGDSKNFVEADSTADSMKDQTTIDASRKSQVNEKQQQQSDDMKYLILAEIEKTKPTLSNDENQKAETLDSAIDNNEDGKDKKNPTIVSVQTKFVEEVQKVKVTGTTEKKDPIDRVDDDATEFNMDREKTKEVTSDNAHKILVQIKKEDEYERDDHGDVGTSTQDPLEEFKKPVWAPDEGKETSKSFTSFQGKADMSNSRYESDNDRSFEYPSEYSMKTKSHETKSRHTGKRIVDDL